MEKAKNNKQKTEKNICKTCTHPPHRRLRKKAKFDMFTVTTLSFIVG